MRDESDDATLRELLALAAVGALDPADDERLRAQIADRPDLLAELARHEEAASSLADAVATPPPPALRASVLAAISGVPQESAEPDVAFPPPVASELPPTPPAPVVPITAAGRTRRWWPTIAVAAVAAATVAVLAVGPLRDDDGGVRVADVVSDSDAVTLEFTGELDELQLVVSPTLDAAALVGDGIPSLADEQVYELWRLRDERAERMEIFQPDDDGRVELLLPDEEPTDVVYAITIEPAGGSDQPTSAAVAETG